MQILIRAAWIGFELHNKFQNVLDIIGVMASDTARGMALVGAEATAMRELHLESGSVNTQKMNSAYEKATMCSNWWPQPSTISSFLRC